jgi:two-component system chemotaxis sensor kinase CheA
MDAVVEVVRRPRTYIHAVAGGNATVLRGRTVPVFRLVELLGRWDRPLGGAEALLLIVRAEGESIALEVDRIDDRIDAVVRPPAGLVGSVAGVGGTTLLGDGRVLLVLDPAGILADMSAATRAAPEER